ncbi:DUF7002 family protein [Haliangium ochraceum]|uniref:DUF7002 family protein n=1 Tax=Haliangium ochraceum TaxID=80816 RepID=UPI0018EFBB73|nr:hypothetical protein [Haliangium ochraceum]
MAELYPRLFHMAEAGSWEGIQRHGLRSTSALLDLFEVQGDARRRIEDEHRSACVEVSHPAHGTAVIRDQLPMSDAGLQKALRDELTPRDWYRLLNERVFFWVRETRLERLLGARAYRDKRQTVLVVDTASLLEQHHTRVRLSPYNSGSTKPNPFARGRDTFLPIGEYPFEVWRKKRGSPAEAVVELTVEYAVLDIAAHTLLVKEVGGGLEDIVLWERS